MSIAWEKIFEKSYYSLHTNPRPQINIIHPFTSELIVVELSKIGGWDYNFLGYLAPYVYIPSSQGKVYSKWRRLYLGKQLLTLEQHELLGNIEILPRLWIPDITVRVWQAQGYSNADNTILADLARIESKIDAL